jgi:hypothetical protein
MCLVYGIIMGLGLASPIRVVYVYINIMNSTNNRITNNRIWLNYHS